MGRKKSTKQIDPEDRPQRRDKHQAPPAALSSAAPKPLSATPARPLSLDERIAQSEKLFAERRRQQERRPEIVASDADRRGIEAMLQQRALEERRKKQEEERLREQEARHREELERKAAEDERRAAESRINDIVARKMEESRHKREQEAAKRREEAERRRREEETAARLERERQQREEQVKQDRMLEEQRKRLERLAAQEQQQLQQLQRLQLEEAERERLRHAPASHAAPAAAAAAALFAPASVPRPRPVVRAAPGAAFNILEGSESDTDDESVTSAAADAVVGRAARLASGDAPLRHRQAPQRGPIDAQVDALLDRLACSVPIVKLGRLDGSYLYGSRVMKTRLDANNEVVVLVGAQRHSLESFVGTFAKVETMRLKGLQSAAAAVAILNRPPAPTESPLVF